MTRRLLPLFLCLATTVWAAHDPALLVEARQARAEAIPQVAIQKLRALLKTGLKKGRYSATAGDRSTSQVASCASAVIAIRR